MIDMRDDGVDRNVLFFVLLSFLPVTMSIMTDMTNVHNFKHVKQEIVSKFNTALNSLQSCVTRSASCPPGGTTFGRKLRPKKIEN